MSVRVAINGFGRIGRNVLRAIAEAERTDIEVVGINDLGPVETNAHLLRYDFFVAYAHESRKCVALACVVALRFKEGLDEFGGVWHESLVVLVDGGDCEDGVLADVGVPVLEALSRGCKEGLHEFGFTQLAQEAQGVAADELVGVLEVHSNAVAVQRVSVHPGCHSPTILLTRPRSSPASAFRLSPA